MRHKLLTLFALILPLLLQDAAYAGSYGFPQKAEDAAHSSADTGFPTWFIRRTSDGNDDPLSGTDGDYQGAAVSPSGALWVEPQAPSKQTYMLATGLFTPDSSAPTDLFEFLGSSSKTVKIHKIILNYPCATSFNQTNFTLCKISAAGSTGTSVASTPVPLDSGNSAATASAKHYTDSPGTPATVVGAAIHVISTCGQTTASTSAGFPPIMLYDSELFGQPITLRGTSQGIVVKTAAAQVVQNTSPQLSFTVVWTEENNN